MAKRQCDTCHLDIFKLSNIKPEASSRCVLLCFCDIPHPPGLNNLAGNRNWATIILFGFSRASHFLTHFVLWRLRLSHRPQVLKSLLSISLIVILFVVFFFGCMCVLIKTNVVKKLTKVFSSVYIFFSIHRALSVVKLFSGYYTNEKKKFKFNQIIDIKVQL